MVGCLGLQDRGRHAGSLASPGSVTKVDPNALQRRKGRVRLAIPKLSTRQGQGAPLERPRRPALGTIQTIIWLIGPRRPPGTCSPSAPPLEC